MMDPSPILLSSIAGASTCLGAGIVFLQPKLSDGRRFVDSSTMAFSLALAGSVMITVSLLSIGPALLIPVDGTTAMSIETVCSRLLSFAMGGLSYLALSTLVFPEAIVEQELLLQQQTIITHRLRNNNSNLQKSDSEETSEQKRSWRVALVLFFSLLAHNFPEGLAVAASALESYQLGWAVTLGILIHNIPEGIAIAITCLAARPDKPWLSFGLASVSGLAEPMGAWVAVQLLQEELAGGDTLANVLALVAGIMVTVALLELFPEAERHAVDDNSKAWFWRGTALGVVVMGTTELLLP
jgi:ZIP family zinc transporter